MPPLYSLVPLPSLSHTAALGLGMKVPGTGRGPLAVVCDLRSAVPLRPGPSFSAVSPSHMADGGITLSSAAG